MKLGSIIFITIILCGCSSNERGASIPSLYVPLDSISISRNAGGFVYASKPFSGYGFHLSESGDTIEVTGFLNGKKHGYHKKYYADRILAMQVKYDLGNLHGEKTTYWENGNIRSKASFNNGQVDGTVYEWYRSGEIFKIMNFKDGKMSGLQQAYRLNGKVYANFESKNGRNYGLKRAKLCYGLEDEEVPLY